MIAAMRLSQLQSITGGDLHGTDASFAAVSTDTRTLQPGDLFIALKGPNFNGNAFVAAAAENDVVPSVSVQHVMPRGAVDLVR